MTCGLPRSAGTVVTQLPRELLVAKELADACDVPMCLVDADGNPVHYNEAAKTILLGYRDAAAGLTLAELGARMVFTNIEGTLVALEQLPLMVAVQRGRPAHRWLTVELEGVRLRVEATAFPLRGARGELRGALALFWQADSLSG
jgi:PAS domain-containing protein